MTYPYPGNTAWPADFNGCILTGRYVDLNGNAIRGNITLAPRPEVLQSMGTGKTIVPAAITVALDAAGSFSVVVPATDDPDIQPQRWTYKVTENFLGGRTYDIQAPMNTTQDITQVAPVPSADGQFYLQGVGIANCVVNGAKHLIVTLTNGTVIDAGSVQ